MHPQWMDVEFVLWQMYCARKEGATTPYEKKIKFGYVLYHPQRVP